jgi:anthranilate phosphoribosyltransferase
MKTLLTSLLAGDQLSADEAKETMFRIVHDSIPDEQIVSLMTILQFRGLHLHELTGFRDALLELATPVQLEADATIDVCGTGGDGKNTFNISTCTAFVLADMGYKVVKHGNYGVSSFCGSSTVLETLGYRFTKDPDELQRQLDSTNICFLHAPLFHPALKKVAPLRKALGIPTFFNGIGPLVNPARPTYQLTGTHSLELAKQYRHLLRPHRKAFHVLHGLEGFDELTFLGATRILGLETDTIIDRSPRGQLFSLASLDGGRNPLEAATILRNILSGKGTEEQHTVVAGNTALGLQLFHPELSFESAFYRAYDHIHNGSAIHLLPQS